MGQVEQKIAEIMGNNHYSQEQKELMLKDLMQKNAGTSAAEEYERLSDPSASKIDLMLSEDPEKREEETKQLQKIDPDAGIESDDWKIDYNMPFTPTFAQVQAKSHTFKIGNGKSATIRKLKTGDHIMLAALIPRWKQHLIGNLEINPIYKEFDPLVLLEVLVTNALRDWDFKNNCPTGFALSVFNTIIFFTKEGQNEGGPTIDISDLLDADIDQIIKLVGGMYKGNTVFFMKTYMQHGIIRDVISIVRGLTSQYKKDIKGKLKEIADFHMSKMKSEEEGVKKEKASSGGRATGGTTNSSAPSAKTTKASSRSKK